MSHYHGCDHQHEARADTTALAGDLNIKSRNREHDSVLAYRNASDAKNDSSCNCRLLLKEFHDHRLGATIEDAQYHSAERDFFDDIVTGAGARRDEIDSLISQRLAQGWTLDRLDRPMLAILRAGAYELIARSDVPLGSVISEYVDVAHAFYDKRESGFVNGLLDAIAKEARPARAE